MTHGQVKKLVTCKWANLTAICAVAKDGRNRRVATIDLEAVPMWLASISVGRVNKEYRHKLERYQSDAKAVLAAWFLGVSTDKPGLAEEFAKLKAKFRKLSEYALVTRTVANDALALAGEMTARADSDRRPFGKPSDEDEYMTAREFCDEYDVHDDMGMSIRGRDLKHISRKVGKLSRKRRVPVKKERSSVFGEVNSYRVDILLLWRYLHDLKCRESFEEIAKMIGEGKF